MNRKEFAELVGYSPRQVSAWIAEGMPVQQAGRKGRECVIEPEAAMEWIESRGGTQRDQMSPAQRRLLQVRIEKLMLANAEADGRVIRADKMEVQLFELVAYIVGQLEALPGRLASTIAGMNDAAEIEALLRSEGEQIVAGLNRMLDEWGIERTAH